MLNTQKRNEIAVKLLEGCPDESRNDHEAIAAAIRCGASVEAVLAMPEVNRWPDTYCWLGDALRTL